MRARAHTRAAAASAPPRRGSGHAHTTFGYGRFRTRHCHDRAVSCRKNSGCGGDNARAGSAPHAPRACRPPTAAHPRSRRWTGSCRPVPAARPRETANAHPRESATTTRTAGGSPISNSHLPEPPSAVLLRHLRTAATRHSSASHRHRRARPARTQQLQRLRVVLFDHLQPIVPHLLSPLPAPNRCDRHSSRLSPEILPHRGPSAVRRATTHAKCRRSILHAPWHASSRPSARWLRQTSRRGHLCAAALGECRQ